VAIVVVHKYFKGFLQFKKLPRSLLNKMTIFFKQLRQHIQGRGGRHILKLIEY
jgi:hypothetical protein